MTLIYNYNNSHYERVCSTNINDQIVIFAALIGFDHLSRKCSELRVGVDGKLPKLATVMCDVEEIRHIIQSEAI